MSIGYMSMTIQLRMRKRGFSSDWAKESLWNAMLRSFPTGLQLSFQVRNDKVTDVILMKLNLRICAKQYQHIDNQNSHNQYIRLIHLSDDFVPHWTCQFLPVALSKSMNWYMFFVGYNSNEFNPLYQDKSSLLNIAENSSLDFSDHCISSNLPVWVSNLMRVLQNSSD